MSIHSVCMWCGGRRPRARARTHSHHLVEWCAGCLNFIGYGQTVSSCLRALVGARVGSARPPDRLCNLMPLEVARFLPVAHPPPPIRPSFVAANSPPPPLGRRRQMCVGGVVRQMCVSDSSPPPPRRPEVEERESTGHFWSVRSVPSFNRRAEAERTNQPMVAIACTTERAHLPIQLLFFFVERSVK